ncbi:lytic polysaccharide monooxygenase [Streptomyces sp. NPDC086766]|uniref:lytic polysaccharide monooxygenase auxiliary activity family 9 protein n=1 Tax=Streptomyces sp. NPDC086766 TaxID=3365754 RepID=UPI0038024811
MTAPLRVTGAAAAASALLTVWAAVPAQAHGAPVDPVSRVFACSPDGGDAGTAACRAAIAANGAPFTAWDNLRVANVNGRDRRTIPDGKLCSGGLPAYKGLDLARADWPSTRLAPGAKLTLKYASTIPHEGTFKLYLTKPGYDPAKPLTWSDLPARPFAEVKDPAFAGGAYRIGATLPADRTGRHVLFTVWQNSSTPDTYYSCSDVVFTGGTGGTGTGGAGTGGRTASGHAPAGQGGTAAASGTSAPAGTAAAAPRSGGGANPDTGPVAATTGTGSGPSAPMLAGGAAVVLVLTGGAALALRLRRR